MQFYSDLKVLFKSLSLSIIKTKIFINIYKHENFPISPIPLPQINAMTSPSILSVYDSLISISKPYPMYPLNFLLNFKTLQGDSSA